MMREPSLLPIGQVQSTVYADTAATRRLLSAFCKERGLPPKPTAPEMENVFYHDPYTGTPNKQKWCHVEDVALISPR
jgi:hypothetical protein